MKKVAIVLFLAVFLFSLCACGSAEPESDTVTIRQIVENKEFPEGKPLTVTLKSFISPVLAVIEDESGASVNLFGVFVDGEMQAFEMVGIKEGSSFTIQNGRYNEFEGTIEIVLAELVCVNE